MPPTTRRHHVPRGDFSPRVWAFLMQEVNYPIYSYQIASPVISDVVSTSLISPFVGSLFSHRSLVQILTHSSAVLYVCWSVIANSYGFSLVFNVFNSFRLFYVFLGFERMAGKCVYTFQQKLSRRADVGKLIDKIHSSRKLLRHMLN